MKKLNTLCLVLITFFTISSCKQESTITYNYSDKDYSVTCGNTDMKLFKEAMYSFEDDILKYYNKTNKDLYRAYRSFVNEAIYNRAQNQDIVSDHTKDVFTALKAKTNLWNGKTLNYNHPIISCIGENISNKDLKTTYNALVSTNSMSPKLFGAPLRSQTRELTKDKHLATFVALDLFYSKLFDVDFVKAAEARKKRELEAAEAAKKAKVDFNKTPNDASKKDPHSGHNHKAGEQHY